MGGHELVENLSPYSVATHIACPDPALSPHWFSVVSITVLRGEGQRAAEWKHLGSSHSYCAKERGDLQEIPELSGPVSSSGHWGHRYLLYLLHRLGMSSKWETRCENALKSLKALSTCKLWFLSLPTLSEVTLYISFCDKES